MPSTRSYEVLVVGAGPAGASAGVLARPPRPRRRRRRAQDVPSREDLRRRPDAPRREAAAGHGPGRRAGQVPPLRRPALHRAGAVAGAARGPSTPCSRSYGYVVRRRDLDWMVALNAEAAGATLLQGADAIAPVIDRGFVRGAVVQTGRRAVARRAAGPLRRGGRRRQQPLRPRPRHVPHQGVALRHGHPHATGRRPAHAEPWIESALDVKDRNGNPLPGYGWIFPVGDGTREHRRRAALDVPGLQERQHHPPPRRATRHRWPSDWEIDAPHPTARKPTSGRHPDGRLGRAQAGLHLSGGRRRRRLGEPLQRRGHRLRLRDRPHGRRHDPRGAGRPQPARAGRRTPSTSRPSTGSTSRWPACSPASSAGRRSCGS